MAQASEDATVDAHSAIPQNMIDAFNTTLHAFPYTYADTTLNCQQIIDDMMAVESGNYACFGVPQASKRRAVAHSEYWIKGNTEGWDWYLFKEAK